MISDVKRIAVITARGNAAGGAERFNAALVQAIGEFGHDVEEICLPVQEPDVETILKNYEAFAALDLSGFDAVISTKAPSYAVSHPNHILYLVHTVRVFDDMFSQLFPVPGKEDYRHRHGIHGRDFQALQGVRKRFAIGHEVASRLYRWRGLDAQVLHPPLATDGFYCGSQGDYFFLPGRLHKWKRVDLVIQAVKESSLPLQLIISGTGEDERELRALAGEDSRIQFRGHVTDEELRDLYAGALAVPFVPIREDYGYVTLEAFASSKPVITCTDSGEPARLVSHGRTGFVSSPDSASLCRFMESLFQNREQAREMGAAGKNVSESMSWNHVAATLLEAAFADSPVSDKGSGVSGNDKLQVAVLDMQPIDPPVGGGRQRLLGLYHNLGRESVCEYAGTYDWDGEPFREQWLSKTLRETLVPLSADHHKAAAALAEQCNGKVVIDMAFSGQACLSPEWVEKAREKMASADVVIFSHPWAYPLLADQIQPHQIVVYDSHNVEGFLRAQLLDQENPVEKELLRRVVEDEYHCGLASDLLLACSHEDLARFHRIYEFPPEKMRIVPNGVMAFAAEPPNREERSRIRRELGIACEDFLAVFIGSAYGPNIQAAEFIENHLAPALPQVTFVIMGGAGQELSCSHSNLIWTGQVSESDKIAWLKVSDIAVNPMFSGSGTNIKMFDFMAFGLPVVTTVTGARGITSGQGSAFLVVSDTPQDFVQAISSLRKNPEQIQKMALSARECVVAGYAWENISSRLGAMLASRARMAGQPRPEFSVIVPTFDRHARLDELMSFLSAQVERDFEVIIVDQTPEPWAGKDLHYGMPMTYFHTEIAGAARARNTGAALASGNILAFTDDDCQPRPEWLLNARRYFDNPSVAGVEGLIVSDHHGDPDYRQVTNEGAPGIGFMTANLMVRSAVFQLTGGFDLQFDLPHFREDTDLGWRIQTLGAVPHARDVVVFHPAQLRRIDRESVETRAAFFQNDALLYRKHPEKYKALFLCERHFETYPGFVHHLIKGFEKTGQAVPAWMEAYLEKARGETA